MVWIQFDQRYVFNYNIVKAHHHWGEIWHVKNPYLSLVASHSWIIEKSFFHTHGFATQWGKIHTTLLLRAAVSWNITLFGSIFVEIFRKVGWFCLIWDIYARLGKNGNSFIHELCIPEQIYVDGDSYSFQFQTQWKLWMLYWFSWNQKTKKEIKVTPAPLRLIETFVDLDHSIYSVECQWCLDFIHTRLLSWSIPSIKGYGSIQDVIDGPHFMLGQLSYLNDCCPLCLTGWNRYVLMF